MMIMSMDIVVYQWLHRNLVTSQACNITIHH